MTVREIAYVADGKRYAGGFKDFAEAYARYVFSRAGRFIMVSFALTDFALHAKTPEFISIRDQIVARYQHSIDALSRGDADAAMQMDTDDWTSVVVGQLPRSKQERAPFIRRDIATMKPPVAWKAVGLPRLRAYWHHDRAFSYMTSKSREKRLRFFASPEVLTTNPSAPRSTVVDDKPTR
jgi:hypothetical protein